MTIPTAHRRNPAAVGGPLAVMVLGLLAGLGIFNDLWDWDRLPMIGWIVFAAGLIALILAWRASAPRPVSSATTTQVDPNTGSRHTETVQDT